MSSDIAYARAAHTRRICARRLPRMQQCMPGTRQPSGTCEKIICQWQHASWSAGRFHHVGPGWERKKNSSPPINFLMEGSNLSISLLNHCFRQRLVKTHRRDLAIPSPTSSAVFGMHIPCTFYPAKLICQKKTWWYAWSTTINDAFEKINSVRYYSDAERDCISRPPSQVFICFMFGRD